MSELKPCPFCGGKADFTVTGDRYPFRVKCGKCRAEAGGTAFDNDEFNAECWNRRASPWIPCKDRLPEGYGEYLGSTRARPNGWVFVYAPIGWICSDDFPVTHWQPLPAPPDKDEA